MKRLFHKFLSFAALSTNKHLKERVRNDGTIGLGEVVILTAFGIVIGFVYIFFLSIGFIILAPISLMGNFCRYLNHIRVGIPKD